MGTCFVKSISVELMEPFESSLEFLFLDGDLGAFEVVSEGSAMELATDPPRLFLRRLVFESYFMFLFPRPLPVGGSWEMTL